MLTNIDRIVGEEVKNLGKLESQITVLTASISSLEKKIDYWTLSKRDSVFAKLKESQEKLSQLLIKAEQLSILIEGFVKDSEPLFCKLFPFIDQVISLQNKINYHQLLQFGKFINRDLKDALHLKDYERIAAKFQKLQETHSQMHGTQCGNLHNYFRRLKQEWAKTIYLPVKRSVEDVMVEIGWPFISTNQPLENVKRTTDDDYKKFQSLLKILALLNNEVDPDSECIWEMPSSISGLSLPMRHLTKPLKKRFEYHFSSNRQTNDLSWPELYLTQILDWCKRPCAFLSEWVQPVFDSINIDSKEEFTRALCGLVVVKLNHDLPLLYEDDYLFGHCIEEILAFERELRFNVHYRPSVHETLTGEHTLEKWLRIEKKYAIEKMDAMLSSDTAWLSTSDVEFDGATVLYVTEVAEKFAKTLLAMTDRYNILPQREHRFQFLDLQLELLEDFRIRMLQMKNEFEDQPLGESFCGVLNTVHYVTLILEDWEDTTT
jgi:hypothetical protein